MPGLVAGLPRSICVRPPTDRRRCWFDLPRPLRKRRHCVNGPHRRDGRQRPDVVLPQLTCSHHGIRAEEIGKLGGGCAGGCGSHIEKPGMQDCRFEVRRESRYHPAAGLGVGRAGSSPSSGGKFGRACRPVFTRTIRRCGWPDVARDGNRSRRGRFCPGSACFRAQRRFGCAASPPYPRPCKRGA